jgi:hypothetical protein
VTQVSLLFLFDSHNLIFKIWSIFLNWSCLKSARQSMSTLNFSNSVQLIYPLFYLQAFVEQMVCVVFPSPVLFPAWSRSEYQGEKKYWSKDYSLTWVDSMNFFSNFYSINLGHLVVKDYCTIWLNVFYWIWIKSNLL